MKFELTKPCNNCPFRYDVEHQYGWLGEERAEEIIDSLERGETFPCHKTTVDDEDSKWSERVATADSQHCAGALILLEHLEQPNQMMRIAERLKLYDRTKLKMDSPVFDETFGFIEWHAG